MTHKNKASAKKIESVLPLERIVRMFETRFMDPHNDPNAALTTEDFVQSFHDIPRSHVEEALEHYAKYSDSRVLKSGTVTVLGLRTRIWFIHNDASESELEFGASRQSSQLNG